ncbi:peptide MFS transporter [Lacticaseibacillus camelliae]|uniref:Amino acid peptide transporter n=1 Tax=Lacticaseibacillus camelliae DSM 22697 = JCM 13995 TaxID=1423730 RepID=A0A0R2F7Y8_9LACO|nr:oligopeptide:H+ symporter [Lacticaseibacillus camelliae]KRN24496.1 amino acid peptide transporter [Lacticaseibacillus camelliae DSM 22697 = JCM 13995]
MAKQNGVISQQPPAFKLMALGSLGTGFATYAVSAIMILYLYEPLHLGGLGLDRITATQIMAVFSSLGYVAGIAGSYAADRLVGLRKPYLYGTLLKIFAIALLAVPHGGRLLFFASLVLQVVASGVTGQSLNALVGLIYRQRGTMRNTAFTLLYIISNIGAAGPIVTGAVAVRFGYNAGFLVAVFVLALTTAPYVVLNRRYLGDLGVTVPDPLLPTERRRLALRVLGGAVIVAAVIGGALWAGWLTAGRFSSAVGILGIVLPVWYMVAIVRSPKVTKQEARHVKTYSLFLIGNSITMLVYGQATGILSLYTLDQVNLNVWGWHLSAASFQTIPAVLAVLFGSVISGLWTRLGRRQPNASLKFGIGMLFWGAGPLFMILPLRLFPANVKVSPLWIVMFYVLIIAGETLTSPIGTALASEVAPAAYVTQMMTVFTLSQAAGSGLSAIAANFYTPGHEVVYFLVIGAIAVWWGIVMLIANRRIARAIVK